MKSDINDLCEAFLAALTNAGYAVKSIENYKQVSNRFKKFCAENGYDIQITVTKVDIFTTEMSGFTTPRTAAIEKTVQGRINIRTPWCFLSEHV